MAVYTVLERLVLDGIVGEYGLGRLVATRGIATGSVNSNLVLETAHGKHLLRIDEVKGELDVKREIDLLLFLRKAGFPCPQPVADRGGRFYREVKGKWVSLYRWIDGHVLPVERLSADRLEQAGRALARLHQAGRVYKKGIENRFGYERIVELYGGVRRRLPAYFKRIVRTLDDEIEYLRHYLETKLPRGIIHGDLFPDNLLFKGEELVAVLDFEAAARGRFTFDLATAVNALGYVRDHYDLRRFEALMAGYESVRPLSLAEWDAFPNELRVSALRFTVTRLRDFFLHPVAAGTRVEKDFRDFYERLRVLRREREGGMEGLLMAMATGYDYRKYQRVKALERKGST